jgi:EAL domain-containing protein (putative c-di-GMP-specific phosphodiesterase class I)/PAS domain-containing protein
MNTMTAESIKQNHLIRLLMIDHQQNNFNFIQMALQESDYQIQAKLIDDLHSFEKLINLQWDVIIFHSAYDLNYEQTLKILNDKDKNIPLILLSSIDVRSADALNIYKLGVFSILDPDKHDYIALMLIRAAALSRTLRQKQKLALEVDQLQQQSQSLVNHTDYAVAIFHEGIHVSVNAQYIALFGQTSAEDFIGLPIMDVLCPQDTQQFKKAYKRFSHGDFSDSPLSIQSSNPQCQDKKLLLQFSSTHFEQQNDLQLVIIADNLEQQLAPLAPQDHLPGLGLAPKALFLQKINQQLQHGTPLALIIFALKALPDELFLQDWDLPTQYFKQLEARLKPLSPHPLERIAEHLYAFTITNPNLAAIDKYLQQLHPHLPHTILLGQQEWGCGLYVAHSYLQGSISPTELDRCINLSLHQAQTRFVELPESKPPLTWASPSTAAVDLDLGEPLLSNHSDNIAIFQADPFVGTLAEGLADALQHNKIALYYQQIYDKEDIDTHFYEVNACFDLDQTQYNLSNCDALFFKYPQLAVKAHRWVLVEACKQLHSVVLQQPKAKLFIALHSVCFQDAELLSLLTKLIALVNAKYAQPIYLQLKESDLALRMDSSLRFVQFAREHGFGLTIYDFGISEFSPMVLSKLDVHHVQLSPQLSLLLGSDDGLVELQTRIDDLKLQIPDIRLFATELNDMTAFANAWNVDIRYLLGDYFQQKQHTILDSRS